MRCLATAILLLASCSRSPGNAPPPEPRGLDESEVKAKSHAFFEAVDRADADAFEKVAGSSFTRFNSGWRRDKGLLLKDLKATAERHAPPTTRTWSEEHVALGRDTATFIGEAVEHLPARGQDPASEYDGWNTLVWVRDGSDWKVTLWQRARAQTQREVWNDTYLEPGGFNHEPNRFLMDSVNGRGPGTALDLAMGQGRNSVYLASKGWKVTGVDISNEGIRIARETATKQKLALDAIEADLDKWDLGTGRWDLVTMIYCGADVPLVERAKTALKRGGLFVVEVFHADGTGGTRSGGFATGQLAALFKDGFKVLHDEVVEDRSDWGGPSKIKLVRFAAEKR